MPDEAIGGFITRYLLISGNAKQKDITQSIFTAVTGQWRIFPHINQNLKRYFKYDFFDGALVLTNNTLISLYQTTGHWDFLEIYKELLISKRGSDAYTYFEEEVVSEAETMVVDIKFCPYCFEDQIDTQGFSWFRRDWLVPGISCCTLHNCSLINATQQSNDTYKNGFEIAIAVLQTDPREFSSEMTHQKESNPYYEWVLSLLEDSLPPFSPKLRIFLMQQTCIKLGADESWPIPRIADLLAHTFFSEGHPWHSSNNGKQREQKETIYKRCIKEALSWSGSGENFHPYSYVIPSTCLLYPLSWAFPDFKEFTIFLEKVSSKKTKYSLSGKQVNILDLKKGINLFLHERKFTEL